mmetsp:Transcript_43132/g.104359  ORF Transcript_43132/g.104359 Transcript_43132/m.104359 type:complete len:185 (-) Transcript_43132:1346-1900(-)
MFWAATRNEQEESKTSSPAQDDESFEVSYSSHASYLKEREQFDHHSKIRAAESRSALKGSLYSRVQSCYDHEYTDEDEKDVLEEETDADRIKRMRAKRLAAEKQKALKDHRVMMTLAVSEKDCSADPPISLHLLEEEKLDEVDNTAEAQVVDSSEDRNCNFCKDESLQPMWVDFGCGAFATAGS